ncbi:MAG: phthalate 4,5-dioxygenase [Chloroflexi bacterium]|nr:phthalate 4,5-dioxygenase [Chloroflexota bacterium]
MGGLIYTYMGTGEPPELPPFDFVTVPEAYRVNTKVLLECNYLQGHEGNLDPVHLSFLHRMATDDPDSAQAFNAVDTHPTIEIEETEYGARIYCVRKVSGDRHYVRITNYIVPNFSAVSGTADGYTVNWHMPIDDTHHWRYMIRFSRTKPLADDGRFMGRSEEITAEYRLVRDRNARYLQDRESMRTWSFCGLGRNFLPHDTCATEGPGPIQDRTQEHLGSTDKGILIGRKILLSAIRGVQEGRDPPCIVRNRERPKDTLVARSDIVLPASVDWHNYWEDEAIEPELAVVPR